MATDYEKFWPRWMSQWCEGEIAQIARKISENPPAARKAHLEQQKSALERMKSDYEAKLKA
jgi:hypothetical protein